jgi:hypothetical protein
MMPDDTKPVAKRAIKRSANERLAERLGSKDELAGLEGYYREQEVTFHSAELKRDFLRYFDRMQTHLHVVSTVGRNIGVPEEKVAEVELALKTRIVGALEHIKNEIKRAEKVLQSDALLDAVNAMKSLEPMVVIARVRSPIARRYLEAQKEADSFVRYMDLLIIEEGVTQAEGHRAKSEVRRLLRKIATLSRFSAINIRKLAPADKSQRPAESPDEGSDGADVGLLVAHQSAASSGQELQRCEDAEATQSAA